MKAISLSKFHEIHDKMKGRVRYHWSSKASPDTQASDVKRIDCSGYVRFQLGKQGVDIPDGSINQRDWFLANCESKTYRDICDFAGEDPTRLFVAGFARGGNHRHIWFVSGGKTYESGSSIEGVGSRKAQAFLSRAQWAVEIPVL